MLQTTFKVADADTAMKNFSDFQIRTIGRMDRHTHLSPPVVDQFHAFHSLIYHLLPKDARLDVYRNAIDDTFTALELPPRLTEEEVKAQMPNILAFTAPTLKKDGR